MWDNILLWVLSWLSDPTRDVDKKDYYDESICCDDKNIMPYDGIQPVDIKK